ncbi:MAG TPA: response regulator transcription factor [Anaerolinea sp.]|nr:response regulator transcription factor [Anaerolinea sp.]
MEKKRVLIADDHPLFRHGIRALLESTPEFEVCAEATNGEEVIARADELHPDVILMDIHMPGVNGIEATRRILSANPGIYILIVTMFEDDSSVFTAMRAGARGYVLKDAQKQDLLLAIRAVGSGDAIFSPAIAGRMIAFFNASRPATVAQSFPELTEREREILGLMAQGMNNTEISARLVLSASTVRNYVSSIFSKLQVADRAQAIVKAKDAGL